MGGARQASPGGRGPGLACQVVFCTGVGFLGQTIEEILCFACSLVSCASHLLSLDSSLLPHESPIFLAVHVLAHVFVFVNVGLVAWGWDFWSERSLGMAFLQIPFLVGDIGHGSGARRGYPGYAYSVAGKYGVAWCSV